MTKVPMKVIIKPKKRLRSSTYKPRFRPKEGSHVHCQIATTPELASGTRAASKMKADNGTRASNQLKRVMSRRLFSAGIPKRAATKAPMKMMISGTNNVGSTIA